MQYGAKGALWAKLKTAATTAKKPAYDEAVAFDNGVNEVAETLNFAEGSAYGDNQEKINIKEFSNGTLAVKAVYIPPETKGVILGAATDEAGGMLQGSEDNPPIGAYGFYANKMDAAKTKYYEVIFYPKVTGATEGKTAKTKEDSITLEYDSLSFRVQASEYKSTYRISKQFSTEAEAVAYLAGLFDGTSAWPGDEATA